MNEILKTNSKIEKLLPPHRPQPGKRYVRSQFAMPFEHRGKKYVFHTLTRQCLETAVPESCGAGEGYDDLIEALYLVPEGKDECRFYESISNLMRIYHRKKGERSYTILPTTGCNARCVYCYEEGMKQVTMTPETAEQTVRYILDSHAGDKVKIVWFGGEPLLGISVIDRVCDGIREAGVPFRCSMVSNGSLITPEIVDRMVESWNLDHIQISMDGRESDYVSRKRYPDSRDQYHTVLSGIELMAEKGISVQIRCNVDWENLDGVQEYLDDLKRHVPHRDRVAVYLAPIFEVRTKENALEFWKKMLEARTLIEEAGFNRGSLPGFKKDFRVNYCMADGGGVVICPDGVLSPCEHLQQEAKFGDVRNGITDEAARREFSRTDRTREKCRKCTFLPECTSFANCPIRDENCREMHYLVTVDALRRLIDKREDSDSEGDDDPIC